MIGSTSSGDMTLTWNFKFAIMSKAEEFKAAFTFGEIICDFRRPYTYKAKYCKLSDILPGSFSPYPAAYLRNWRHSV